MNKKLLFLSMLFAFLLLGSIGYNSISDGNRCNDNLSEKNKEINQNIMLKSSSYWDNLSFIHIQGNWTNAVAKGWAKGDGSWGNPYVLENLTIDASSSYRYAGIQIENSINDYFIIRNCTIFNTIPRVYFYGIYLYESNNGTIEKCNLFNDNDYGIYLSTCNNLTINNNTILNCGTGIYLDTTSNVYLGNNTIIDCYEGIFIFGGMFFECFNITLKDNNFTRSGISVYGLLNELKTHLIDITNKANEKPIYYYVNRSYLNNANFSNAGQILMFYCNNSVISNQNVTLTSTGITLMSCYNNTILKNNVSNNTFGILLYEGCENNTIDNNTIMNNGMGIIIQQCHNNTIKKNYVYNNGNYGILLYFDSNSTVENNTIDNRREAGIELIYSKNATLSANTMINCGILIDIYYFEHISYRINTLNTVNGKPVYYYEDKLNLRPNDFSNAGQVILANCNNSIVSNVNASYGSVGISQYFCYNTSILSNNMSYNLMYGIYLYECDNITIKDSIACYNRYGVYSHYSYNSTIVHNDIFNNTQYGLYLWLYFNGSISQNLIEKNYGYGIYCLRAEATTFEENFVKNNLLDGVYLDDLSIYNVLFNNTFTVKGQYHAYDEGINNKWDNGSLGNYWDDYSGKDANDNGIGDTIYTNIAGGTSQDRYPIWWDAPKISISSPSNYSVYGKLAPQFTISVNEGVQDAIWYALGANPTVYSFSGLTDTINQNGWDGFGNGTVLIHFFANDSRNYISNEVDAIVRKDLEGPSVTINAPSEGELYGRMPPSIIVVISGSDLHKQWYMLTNGSVSTGNYSWAGAILQDVWDQMGNGTVTIRIYANDTKGNENYDEVIVRKDIICPKITINAPSENALFGVNAPGTSDFNVVFSDPNGIKDERYRLWNGSVLTSVRPWLGEIEQVLWDQVGNGTVIITIIANDSVNNVGFSNITVRKDLYLPTIAITLPLSSSVFGITALNFQLMLGTNNNLDHLWYSLYNGSIWTNNYTYSTNAVPGVLSDSLNQAMWNQVGNGSVIVRFYLNDTLNRVTSAEVQIWKDILAPIVAILSPSNNSEVETPSIQLSVIDVHLNKTWYTINGSTQKHFFTGSSIIIDSAIWDALNNSDSIVIWFFANDSLGNIANKTITLIKVLSLESEKEKEDNGKSKEQFDIIAFLTSPFGLGIIGGTIGIVIIAIVVLKKRGGYKATKKKRSKIDEILQK